MFDFNRLGQGFIDVCEEIVRRWIERGARGVRAALQRHGKQSSPYLCAVAHTYTCNKGCKSLWEN